MPTTYKAYYQSDIGVIEIVSTNQAIQSLNFVEAEGSEATVDAPPIIEACLKQLDEYFKGERQVFTLPLEPDGTEFQKSVWQQLLTIPFGQTVSYLDIARQLGNEKAVRAVGLANGRNPISLIIPCHRVIGSDGTLTGYGGGLWRKEWLLKHEGALNGGQMALF